MPTLNVLTLFYSHVYIVPISVLFADDRGWDRGKLFSPQSHQHGKQDEYRATRISHPLNSSTRRVHISVVLGVAGAGMTTVNG